MSTLRPGLSPILTDSVCEKLKSGKVRTVMDFIQADFQYLNKCAQLRHREVLAIRKLLLAQFAVYPTSAADILNEMLTNGAVFRTGCHNLDELLSGGIYTGELTELIGPVAAGKTQFCFTILIQVALLNKKSVLYVDTHGAISNCRLKEMATEKGVSQRDIYEFQSTRVRCARANNIFDLFAILEQARSHLDDRIDQFFLDLRLLIIDSVNPLLASLLGGSHSDANGLMSQLANLLKTLSKEYFLAVIITNNSVNVENSSVKAALGAHWQHAPNTRLLLTHCEGTTKRRITLMKSTRAAVHHSITVNLCEKGFVDVQ